METVLEVGEEGAACCRRGCGDARRPSRRSQRSRGVCPTEARTSTRFDEPLTAILRQRPSTVRNTIGATGRRMLPTRRSVMRPAEGRVARYGARRAPATCRIGWVGASASARDVHDSHERTTPRESVPSPARSCSKKRLTWRRDHATASCDQRRTRPETMVGSMRTQIGRHSSLAQGTSPIWSRLASSAQFVTSRATPCTTTLHPVRVAASH